MIPSGCESTRPVGRPSHKTKVFYHSFMYQAKSWERPRRVVAKVEWHHDEQFPRVGFIVTNLNRRAKNMARFYNKRGDCRAVDQGGQDRADLDAAVVS